MKSSVQGLRMRTMRSNRDWIAVASRLSDDDRVAITEYFAAQGQFAAVEEKKERRKQWRDVTAAILPTSSEHKTCVDYRFSGAIIQP